VSFLFLGLLWAASSSFAEGARLRWLVAGALLSLRGFREAGLQAGWEPLVLALALSSAVAVGRAPFLAGLLAGALPWIQLQWLILFLPLILAARLRAAKRGRLFFSGY
jgi:hypothetical protein